MKRKILEVKEHELGFIIQVEDVTMEGSSPGLVLMDVAYTPQGEYIGDVKTAEFLYASGIEPRTIDARNDVCSIGFCKEEQKWYGWCHRARCGFGIGDVVKEGDCTASSGVTEEYLTEHPEEDHSLPIGFEAKTLNDAKLMAVAFAESVS